MNCLFSWRKMTLTNNDSCVFVRVCKARADYLLSFFYLFRRNVDLAERKRVDFSQCVRDDLRVFSFHAPPMPGFSPCFIIVAVIDFFFLLLFFFFYFTLELRLPWDCTRSRPDTLTGSRWRLPCRSWSPFAKERYDRRRPRYTASISRVLTQRSTIRFQTLSNL